MHHSFRIPAVLILLLVLVTSSTSFARASDTTDLSQLRATLEAQQKLLDDQRRTLEAQQRQLASQEAELKQHRVRIESLAAAAPVDLNEVRGTGTGTGSNSGAAAPTSTAETSSAPVSRTGSDPEEQRPQIVALPDAGGVLTPRGHLSFENGIDYANTTRNQFTFNGVQVSEVVLVGSINNFTARRQLVQYSGRLRLGLTDRLEADVRVPYVYRNDATSVLDTGTGISSHDTLSGNALGDIDMGLAYQINDGKNDWPYFVGNLRFKADNADGPYDVPYNSSNIAKRLPVGSGFKSGEVSLTAIKVTDPAVIYGNVGYVYNHGEDSINKDFGNTRITSVDPGDAINGSVGLGFALNPDLSLSFGYKHSFIFATEEKTQNLTTLARGKVTGETQQVGAVTTGASYRINDRTSINFNVEAGVTSDAPDVRLGVRIPVQLGKIF